ncbi:EF-hand calcium-binding domain-containing protein 11 [Microcaecilia unicolor]|uniref:EF-hand calcium-binding domain-containing protein 11 n=1 Tax=Microcaecilia unicolor TaxID=1415580 RepID=A0A6P7YZH5_9AMPH|nr:EF-hand calcium-binding domain-containing protein 11 [Microcaecilia unicolor]
MFAVSSVPYGTRTEVTDSDRRKFAEVFKKCDENDKGYLNTEDLKVAVMMLFGYKPSKREVESMMSAAQQNTTGMSLDGFLKSMSTKKAAQLWYDEARQIFTAFDMRYRGFLTLDDFKTAFRLILPHFSERMVIEAFREVDQDSDGLVSYKTLSWPSTME